MSRSCRFGGMRALAVMRLERMRRLLTPEETPHLFVSLRYFILHEYGTQLSKAEILSPYDDALHLNDLAELLDDPKVTHRQYPPRRPQQPRRRRTPP